MAYCQIAENTLKHWLPCKWKESGGVQCERTDEHGDEGHYISAHTIRHSISGNGWSCYSFKEPVHTGGYRIMLREKLVRLTEELRGLDEKEEEER